MISKYNQWKKLSNVHLYPELNSFTVSSQLSCVDISPSSYSRKKRCAKPGFTWASGEITTVSMFSRTIIALQVPYNQTLWEEW